MTEEIIPFKKFPLIARVQADGRLKIYPKTPGSDTKPPLYHCRLEHLLCITKDKKFYLDVLQVVKSVGSLPYDVDVLWKYVEDGENWRAIEKIIPETPKAKLFEKVKLHKFQSDPHLLEIILNQRNAEKACWIPWLTAVALLLKEAKEIEPKALLLKYVDEEFSCTEDNNLCVGKLVGTFVDHFPSLKECGTGLNLPLSAMAEQNTVLAIACFDKRCKPGFDVNGRVTEAMNIAGVKCSNGTYIMAALFYFYEYKEESLNKFVESVIDNNAIDVNLQDSNGNTAALYAAALQKEAVFKMIVSHPMFDFTATNKSDESLEQCMMNNYISLFNRTIAQIYKNANEKKSQSRKPDSNIEMGIPELLTSARKKISEDPSLKDEQKEELVTSLTEIEKKYGEYHQEK